MMQRMSSPLPASWRPWRSPSPIGLRRPTKADLAAALHTETGREDVLPYPQDEHNTGLLRMLIIGINPSPWTVAVNAPFARPGNRFWPSLAAAGITPITVDAAAGLSPDDEHLLAELGIGITNFVSRPTARADELRSQELRDGGQDLLRRVRIMRPQAVAILGITAFRAAFRLPKAQLGLQDPAAISGWPADVPLWAMPNPSGLNAHETVETIAAKWRLVWSATF